ncbi:hypothetical protein [Mucilaginibacter phyllosphaerae]
MKNAASNPKTKKQTLKQPASPPVKELETDMPLSEKDEVKKAEQNISKQAKKAT